MSRPSHHALTVAAAILAATATLTFGVSTASAGEETAPSQTTQQSQTVMATVDDQEYTSIENAVAAVNDSNADMPTFMLKVATDKSITFTRKVAVTAESKDFAYSGAMRFTSNASGSTVSGVSFKLGPTDQITATDKGVVQNVIVSGVKNVTIDKNQFIIDSGKPGTCGSGCDWQPSSVWLESGADNTTITDNDFKLGQVWNNSSVGVNLVGSKDKPVKNTTISKNRIVTGPKYENGSSGSMSFIVGNGNENNDNDTFGIQTVNITENTFDGGTIKAKSYFAGFSDANDVIAESNVLNDAQYGMYNTSYKGNSNPSTWSPRNNTYNSVANNNFRAADQSGKEYVQANDALKSEDVTGIKLLVDQTANVTVPEGKTVTLDLNGRTLTNTDEQHTIVNNGTLTITDSSEKKTGVVDNVSHQKAALVANEGATAVLNGGTFKRSKEAGTIDYETGATAANGNSYYTILNKGDMAINDGATVQLLREDGTPAGYSSIIDNGWYSGKPTADGYLAKLTVNGGVIQGGKYVKNDSYGDMVITGGEIKDGADASVLNWNTIKVTGGTFTPYPQASGVFFNQKGGDPEQGKIQVTGGTFVTSDSQKVVLTSSDKYATGDAVISGGTFTGNKPDDKYLAPGYVINSNGTVYRPSTGGGSMVSPSKPEVVVPPANTDVSFGGGLELSGLKVDFHDGRGQVGADGVTVTGLDASKPGLQTVTLASKADSSKKVTIDVLVGFRDVDSTTPHHGEIRTLLARDVTRDFADGTFRGMNSLNRQDLAAFLYRMAGQPDYEPAEADFVFQDVTTETPHYREILWAARNGVVTGYTAPDGTRTYQGGRAILRQDLAAMLYRLAGEPDAGGASFPDVTGATPHAEAIEWAKHAGVTTGFPDNTFKGGRTIVRQDAAAFLGRVIDKNLIRF